MPKLKPWRVRFVDSEAPPSETKFDGELDYPWAGREAHNPPEIAGINVVDGSVVIRVVEEVKKVRPEPQVFRFGQRKASFEREIDIALTWSAQDVASHIADVGSGTSCQSGWIMSAG